MISKEQIRAARAMLGWSQKVLAKECGTVSEPTIKLIESGRINSTENTLGMLQQTFENAGLEFLPQKGVRFRDDYLTVIEKKDENDNPYVWLMEDIYHTVRGKYGEALFSYIDQSLSPQDVIDHQIMIRKAGARMRFLIKHGDTHLRYPLDEYRYLPKGHFLNNTIVTYGTKTAYVINRRDRIVIINDPDIAEIRRMEFNLLWKTGDAPKKSTAEKIYE